MAAGCAGGPSPRPLPAAALEPWQIPQGAYGSQRLYRVSYSGPEGEGSFKVTLRLVSPARYQIQAVDPVGRSLWSLDVSDDSGLWLNHRSRTWCEFEGRFDVAGVPMGPFPLLSLPSLLLGRVPAEPAADSPNAEPAGRQFAFRDATDRRWSGTLGEAGLVQSWILSEGSTPTVWWVRRDDWAILSDRERGVQVRWREVLRENLDREPPRLEIPAGYRQAECGEPDLPESGV
ncbi:MAG TPA: hypothetical protein VF789_13945 [Thermoanaerobaculia bacterium]